MKDASDLFVGGLFIVCIGLFTSSALLMSPLGLIVVGGMVLGGVTIAVKRGYSQLIIGGGLVVVCVYGVLHLQQLAQVISLLVSFLVQSPV